jgi:hypothetical protein
MQKAPKRLNAKSFPGIDIVTRYLEAVALEIAGCGANDSEGLPKLIGLAIMTAKIRRKINA